jgi:transcription elongation factor/antiterminator RfaH
MNFSKLSDQPHWYAIYTHPKQEDRANSNLIAWGVQTFNPKLRERRYNKAKGRYDTSVKALFPQYIFARFVAQTHLSKVWFTRGVQYVVSFGDTIATVEDEVIAYLESELDADGFVDLSDRLKCGDKVQIKDGPLKNLTGIFEKGVKGKDRVIILLNAVSYQGHVQIDRELTRRIA